MTESTKSDKTRQLSQEQMNSIEHLLQGKSDRAVAEAVGVSRQTIWTWRSVDALFIAELNKRRSEMWYEARQRLKSLASHALDAVELSLGSEDPKTALTAAKYILQNARLFDTDLNVRGPTTPEAVILDKLKREARSELMAKTGSRDLNMYRIDMEADTIAHNRMAKALEKAGL